MNTCEACGQPLNHHVEALGFGPVLLIKEIRTLVHAGRRLQIRPTAAAMLELMIENGGKVEKDFMHRKLFATRGMKNLDVQVCMLRHALRDAGFPLTIETTRCSNYTGQPGSYRLVIEPTAAEILG